MWELINLLLFCICAFLQPIPVFQPVAGLLLGSNLTQVLTPVEMWSKLQQGSMPWSTGWWTVHFRRHLNILHQNLASGKML